MFGRVFRQKYWFVLVAFIALVHLISVPASYATQNKKPSLGRFILGSVIESVCVVALVGGLAAWGIHTLSNSNVTVTFDFDGDGEPDGHGQLNEGGDKVFHLDLSGAKEALENTQDKLEAALDKAREQLARVEVDGRVFTPGQLKGVLARAEVDANADDVLTLNVAGQISSEAPKGFEEGKEVMVSVIDRRTQEVVASGKASIKKKGFIKLPSLNVAEGSLERILDYEKFEDAFELRVSLSDNTKLYGRNLQVKVGIEQDPFQLQLGLEADLYPSPKTEKFIP